MAIKNFVEELEWRGMIHSIMPGTQEQLQKEMSTAYVGIDPTADSLHIGHLVSVMILKHFQMCGHRPIALVGGATGMIGDPSGKSQERNLLDEKTLRHNQEAIKKQLAKLLDFESDAPNAAMLVNNYDWMKGITFLDFIRDIGKLITVNYMMAKDSVKKRFNGEGEGMSFTEFTYQLVRTILLPDILRKRGLFSNEQNREKKQRKLNEQKNTEAKFREAVDTFRNIVSENAAESIGRLAPDSSRETIEQIISDAINNNANALGLKTVVDSQKKKILISHASKDKALADLIYSFLVFNNIPPEDILYTSCDDEISRIPEGTASIYNYLRDFFVESYSNQKIFVIFVTSDNTPSAWGAMTEIGASWITQVDNRIFNIPPFRPQHPLNDEALWHSTERNENDELCMTKLNADIFCQKIEATCDKLGYAKKSRKENMDHLKERIVIK